MAKKDEPKSTEYPKSLHQGGDRNAEHKIVEDENEEGAARAAGFKMIDKDKDAESAARLAKPAKAEKAAEVPEPKGKAKK